MPGGSSASMSLLSGRPDRIQVRTGYLIEEQGMSYLAETDSDSALTPEAGGGLHLSHCARTSGGTKSAEPANRPQPTGRFHAAGLRQRVWL
jgi:hypothetical protein